MAVLHLLLKGDSRARAIPELASVVATHNAWSQGRKFLLVPYHMIGARSMESAILGHYVEYIRTLHPEAPLPGVYLAERIFADAGKMRTRLGDEAFFANLNAGGGGGGLGNARSIVGCSSLRAGGCRAPSIRGACASRRRSRETASSPPTVRSPAGQTRRTSRWTMGCRLSASTPGVLGTTPSCCFSTS